MSRRRSRVGAGDYWPGFVDALTTLLLVFIFLLVVFVLAQVLLSMAISGKDAAIDRLNRQVAELSNLLSLERQGNASLRLDIAQLSASLQSAVAQRDDLAVALKSAREKLDEVERRAGDAEQALLELRRTQTLGRENLGARLKEIESLQQDVEALRRLRAQLERQIAGLSAALTEAGVRERQDSTRHEADQSELDRLKTELETAHRATAELASRLAALQARLEALQGRLETQAGEIATRTAETEKLKSAAEATERRLAEQAAEAQKLREAGAATERELGALRDRSKELEARLADQRERTLLAQKEIADRDIRLRELVERYNALQAEAAEKDRLNEAQRTQVEALNRQILALRQQLTELAAALDAAEQKDKASEATIADLGRRLNRALAQKVEELARYRSEFFGRLREILGDRPGIQIVGDRFVLQSEVLFDTGSAEIGQGGEEELRKLAGILSEIARSIPTEIPWVLRVDGHTDRRPIATARFPSNWELSTARAVAVVRSLVELGIPPERLAATGFAAFQPLDDRDDEIAYRRNRRIEFKLTER